jgi:hypothetical protein
MGAGLRSNLMRTTRRLGIDRIELAQTTFRRVRISNNSKLIHVETHSWKSASLNQILCRHRRHIVCIEPSMSILQPMRLAITYNKHEAESINHVRKTT